MIKQSKRPGDMALNCLSEPVERLFDAYRGLFVGPMDVLYILVR
jgi:hypothetical protein